MAIGAAGRPGAGVAMGPFWYRRIWYRKPPMGTLLAPSDGAAGLVTFHGGLERSGQVLGDSCGRLDLEILKQHPDRRQSLIMKRRACGWSDEFLMEVIAGLTC
jgi:hypothetical protein